MTKGSEVPMHTLVTGGAGYLGSVLSLALLEAGHQVSVLDNLTQGGRGLLPLLGHPRFRFIAGDIRDPRAVEQALVGAEAVVHLAAIVGDPACAREPDNARAINQQGAIELIAAARAAAVPRLVFASTCSNYGRMAETSVLADESHVLRPVSLYAETKVAVERAVLDLSTSPTAATVLRFATLFGTSPRMRFDLTVNQFVAETLAHGSLTVFGEQFWRPYVHVREAARAIMMVLAAPTNEVAGQVFNVGRTDENYRKLDLVEIIDRLVGPVRVEYVTVAEDPRDYKVSFERIRQTLGFVPERRVPAGVREIADAIASGAVDDPSDPRYSNVGRVTAAINLRSERSAPCVP